MSFYLGAALQLFGREQDRLYHVLVSPEFEALKDFYYKPLKDRSIEVHNDKGETIRKLNTKDAEICLSELPFVRLREKIPLTGSDIFQIVSQGQKEIDTAIIQPELNVDIEQHIIYIGDKKIEIVPNQLAFYLYFLRTKLEKCKLPGRKYCLDCTECFEETAEYTEITVVEKMSEDYDKMYGKTSIRSEKFFDKWTKEETCFDKEMVRSKISKINRTIKEELEDLTLLPFYQITSVGKHGNKKYGVRVEKGKIEIYAE
jgi:CRISPR-associated protein Csx14